LLEENGHRDEVFQEIGVVVVDALGEQAIGARFTKGPKIDTDSGQIDEIVENRLAGNGGAANGMGGEIEQFFLVYGLSA